MKYKFRLLITGIFFCLWPPALSFGQVLDSLFLQANTSYEKMRYAEALSGYRKIAAAGYESSVLYFNMGNASYKLGHLPEAILFYEKARRLRPDDRDIRFNLKVAQLKTVDKIEIIPEFFLQRWCTSLILVFPLYVFAVGGILFVLFGSAALIFYFFSSVYLRKKIAFYISVLLFTVGILLLVLARGQERYFADKKQAIIFSSPVSLKSSPVKSGKSVSVLHEGTSVTVTEVKQDWVHIRLTDGRVGWVYQTDLRRVN